MPSRFAVALICLLLPALALAGPVETAQKRLDKGEYKDAIAELEALAVKGEAGSQLALARAYVEVGRLDDAVKAAGAVKAEGRKSDATWHAQIVVANVEGIRGQYKSAITKLKAVVKARPLLFEARVRLAELRWLTGTPRSKLAEADAIADYYEQGDVTTARDLVWLGRALTLTEYYKNANEIFTEAIEQEKGELLGHFYWADLFIRAGENEKEADTSVKEILKRNPKHPGALTLTAMMDISSDNDSAAAKANADKALAVNPSYIDAHQTRARALIETEQYDAALTALDPALAINPHHPMTWAMIAATRLLKEDKPGFEQAMKTALAVNPRYAAGYHMVAEIIERRHRYKDAIAFERKAIALDAEYWPAWVGLGVGLSRAGADDEAAKVLAQAFDGDGFNVRAYNMLEFFYDGAAKRMDWTKAGHFRVRLDRDEKELLEPLVVPLLDAAWKRYTHRYSFEPKAPLHIEYFPDRKVFAVRTIGTPGLAAHGVCFGHVVTVASPSNADHNWRMVMWHELAHVWHHQMSDGRAPRWFTEGLAEFETAVLKSYWKREMDAELWDALQGGRLKGIVDFNTMFTQAKSIEDMVLAYYYATQVVRFIDHRWGETVFPKMLRAWGDKQTSRDVFQNVLQIDVDDFDKALREWLAATWLVRFRDSFDPEKEPANSPDGAIVENVRALMSSRSFIEAAKALDDLFQRGKDSVALRKMRAVIATATEDWAGVRDAAQRAAQLDPQDAEVLSLLRGAQQKLNDADGEYATLKAMAEIHEDSAELLVRIVQEASRRGDIQDVIEYAERALEVAPFAPEVQEVMTLARIALAPSK